MTIDSLFDGITQDQISVLILSVIRDVKDSGEYLDPDFDRDADWARRTMASMSWPRLRAAKAWLHPSPTNNSFSL